MRFLINVCKFLCFVIAFYAVADERSVFNQTCGPETQPREPFVEQSDVAAVRKVIRHRTTAAPEALDPNATHVTIVIPRASVDAILRALQTGQQQGDLVAVTLPMLPARDAFLGLHVAMLPERVTRMTLRE